MGQGEWNGRVAGKAAGRGKTIYVLNSSLHSGKVVAVRVLVLVPLIPEQATTSTTSPTYLPYLQVPNPGRGRAMVGQM